MYYAAYYTTDEIETEMMSLFEDLTGTEVARLFLDWHGTQLLTREFYVNTRDVEGYDLPLLSDEEGGEE